MKKRFIFALLIILVPLLVFTLSLGKPSPKTSSALPTPTPVALPQGEGTSSSPSFQYSKRDTDKLLNTIDNRVSLSAGDARVRTNLTALANQQTDMVYSTSDFTLFYIHAADVFQAEIDTTNVDKAKQSAVSYLSSQGLSQNGICNLPLVFYLQVDVRNQLKSNGYVFSPLAPGC